MALEQAVWEAIKIDTPYEKFVGFINARMARLFHLLQRLQRRNTRSVSAATTLTEADDILLVSTSGGGVTVTLPLAASTPKVRFAVKKISNDANTLTVARSGADTIDAAASFAWTTYNAVYEFESCLTAVGTWNWLVL